MDNEDKLTRLDSATPDDLTRIKGISERFANIMKEADINTFAKLAAYPTAEQIQSDVKTKTDHEIPLWRIENKGKPYGSWMRQAGVLAPQEKATSVAPNSNGARNTAKKWKQHKIVKICTVELGFNGETDEQGKLVPKVSLYREDFGDGPTHRFDEYNKWVGWIAEEADWPVPELVTVKEIPQSLTIQNAVKSNIGTKSEQRIDILLKEIGKEPSVDAYDVTLENPNVLFPEGDTHNARISFQILGQDAVEFVKNEQQMLFNIAFYYYLERLRAEYQSQLAALEAEVEKRVADESFAETAVPPKKAIDLVVTGLDIDLADGKDSNLRADVNFRISGADVERLLEQRTTYQVEAHTLNLETGESQLAGYQLGQLEPEKFNYPAEFEFPMLDLGRYELQSIILLFLPGEVVSYYQGDTFKIVR